MARKLPDVVDYDFVFAKVSKETPAQDRGLVTSTAGKSTAEGPPKSTGEKRTDEGKYPDERAAPPSYEQWSDKVISSNLDSGGAAASSSGKSPYAPVYKKTGDANADGRLRDVSSMAEVLLTNPSAINAPMPTNISPVRGVDFDKGFGIEHMLKAFKTTGFQASHLADAVDRVNEMIHWRLTREEAMASEDTAHLTSSEIESARATVFLGMTSNQISSGQREVIRYLCKHNMIDCIVTTGGAVEEDIMKCFAPHYMGDWALKGRDLRVRGINRIGNMVVPNKNYCNFEEWLQPILNECLREQKEKGTIWTPSRLIRLMGKKINHQDSVWYWCYKNNIPVFCPGITDGAFGDVLYFMSYKDDSFIVDVAKDVRILNDISMSALKSGMIILGGGIVKHHICNANLMRNGADWSVFVNTGQEFDGSDSGAKPAEAVSWGKIRLDAKPVKVYGEATVFFPLICAGSFGNPKHKADAVKPERKLHEAYNLASLL